MRIRIYSHKETELFERSEFSVSCEYKEFEYADLENYASYSNCLFFIQYINQFGSCPTPTNRNLVKYKDKVFSWLNRLAVAN